MKILVCGATGLLGREICNKLKKENVDFIATYNNIKVFLDADAGLSIDKCVKINRKMYRTIEENAWYPDGNFSLEVSSAGVDEPLLLIRQYKKNMGRNVEVILNDESRFEGKLLAANENLIQIEYKEGKNKKAVTVTKEIPFDQIKQTTVLIAF